MIAMQLSPEMTDRLAQEVGPDEEDLAGLVLTDDFAPVERLTEATRNLLR